MMLLGCKSACVNTIGTLSGKKERYGCGDASWTFRVGPYAVVNQSWKIEMLSNGPAVGESLSVKMMSNSGCLPT
jgi:hypothetical protein